MRRNDICLYLSRTRRVRLQAILADRNATAKVQMRAKIVLATADRCGTNAIIRRAGGSKPTVWRWQLRYLDEGIDGLLRDKTRPSRIPPVPLEKELKVLTKTTTETPENATHWSRALMAQATGLSPSTIGRIWKRAELKPHRLDTFKVSNDPMFEEKVTDIVGLYLNPPDKAIVLCVDEKSQSQALDRTQPGLPLKKGRAQTMTHDDKRHGATTLFAALDVATGAVISDCLPKHRAKEFIKFLRQIERETPKDRPLHLVMDNYATHKTAEVKAWLKRHPHIHLHFTPTSASWLNLVERLFAEITARRIRRGTFGSVAELETAIHDNLAHRNKQPKPFVWKKSAATILVSESRAKNKLDQIKSEKTGNQASDSEH